MSHSLAVGLSLTIILLLGAFHAGPLSIPPLVSPAYAVTVTITITSNPTGSEYVQVDGVATTTPISYTWTVGATHTLTATGSIACGSPSCQYLWQSWSDSGARSHTYTVPSSAQTVTANGNSYGHDGGSLTASSITYAFTLMASSTTPGKQYVLTGVAGGSPAQTQATNTFTPTGTGTITATYKAQYLLTTGANPSGGGTVTISSSWYDSGTSITALSATPSSGYVFSSWSDGSTSPSHPSFTMNQPTTLIANFVSSAIQVMVTSHPALGSGFLTVDGVTYDTPHVFSWTAGSLHTLAASSPVSCGAGCQYVFVQWSDGATTMTRSYTTPSTGPATITATYKTQYQITIGGQSIDIPTLAPLTPLDVFKSHTVRAHYDFCH